MAGSTETPIQAGVGRDRETSPASDPACRGRFVRWTTVPRFARSFACLIGCATALAACFGPQIQVDSGDPGALRGATSFHVRLAAERGTDADRSEDAGEADLDRVRMALLARGHPVDDGEPDGDEPDAIRDLAAGGGDGTGPIDFELVRLRLPVKRRTYTADTDANGSRLEERTEGIIMLRALETDGKTELWRCTARGLLPKPDAPFGPSEAEVFERLLDRALAQIPPRA